MARSDSASPDRACRPDKLRILVLTKRQYTAKDLLDDRYGRLYEIPEALAANGHDVHGVCLSYRRRASGGFKPGRVTWLSVNAWFGWPRYFSLLRQRLMLNRPDIVWVSSDVFHVIVAWLFCKWHQVPFVADFYDNYESFGASRIPGVKALLRAAARSASGLSLVSHTLSDYVLSEYKVQCPCKVVSNAIKTDVFFPREQRTARENLGLPATGKMIGTAGSISAGRGIAVLFEAFLRLAEQDPDIWLVYAGPRDETPEAYQHPRIVDLGVLNLEKAAEVLSALDVAVICNRDSAFGRYCFPQKFYEMMACGTAFVAADVGELGQLLAEWPQLLFDPGSSAALADGLQAQLSRPVKIDVQPPAWADSAALLEGLFFQLVR